MPKGKSLSAKYETLRLFDADMDTSKLWIKDAGSPPDEGFQYPAISGPNIRNFSFHTLCTMVAQHYAANARPVPTCDDVLKWVCDNQQVSCYEGRTAYANMFTNPPSFLSRGLKGPEWPLILRPLKLLAKEGDRGLGDIVLRVIGDVNSDTFKAWHLRIFGKSCGCSERQEDWNRDYPL